MPRLKRKNTFLVSLHADRIRPFFFPRQFALWDIRLNTTYGTARINRSVSLDYGTDSIQGKSRNKRRSEEQSHTLAMDLQRYGTESKRRNEHNFFLPRLRFSRNALAGTSHPTLCATGYSFSAPWSGGSALFLQDQQDSSRGSARLPRAPRCPRRG